MTASRRFSAFALVLVVGLSSGAAAAQDAALQPRMAATGTQTQADPPTDGTSLPADASRCVLIATGAIAGSSVPTDPRADKFWNEVDRQLMLGLFTTLNLRGYQLRWVFTEIAQRNATPALTQVGIEKSKCPEMIQISNDIGENAQGRYFGFSVVVMHFVQPSATAGGGAPRADAEFSRLYRFALTQDTMDTLRPSEFAATMAADIETHALIGFTRVGTLPTQDAVPVVPPGEKAIDPAILHKSYEMYVAGWPKMEVKDVHLRQIVVASEADARVALARVQRGEAFEKVAQELTIDPLSRDTGGDTGWAQVGAFPIDVARMAQSLEPAGLAKWPVHSPAGWHVIEVLGMRPAAPATYEVLEGKMAAAIRAGQRARKH